VRQNSLGRHPVRRVSGRLIECSDGVSEKDKSQPGMLGHRKNILQRVRLQICGLQVIY